ncbi:MAG: helix-turn-helix domain-containing protein [Gemmatimonadetes bacterium]|nr:helix-turn-helix domain-containing protein [Gemmatimonadota bacterium]
MRAPTRLMTAEGGPTVAVYTSRERTRDLLKHAFPRRRGQLIFCRSAAEVTRQMGRMLVDIVVVDVAAPTEDTWLAAACAREYPCTPFFGISALRLGDAPTISRCAALDFADIFSEGIDDGSLRELVVPASFTIRFAATLGPANGPLGLVSPVQQNAWRWIVGRGGRPVRTDLLADALGVTREHLSRSFSASGGPNLKRVIDLVRVIAAAELAKSPGYDSADVARVLQYASASHLTSTAQRVCGTRSASLARLRTGDIIERFQQGRGRSRG